MSFNDTYPAFGAKPRHSQREFVSSDSLHNRPETPIMATIAAHKSRQSRKSMPKDAMEYRLIFAVCFPVLLVTTLAERLVRGKQDKSFLGEAIEATHRCTSLAFTG
jgi:hypothetical protein